MAWAKRCVIVPKIYAGVHGILPNYRLRIQQFGTQSSVKVEIGTCSVNTDECDVNGPDHGSICTYGGELYSVARP